jgi:hypothetical protein
MARPKHTGPRICRFKCGKQYSEDRRKSHYQHNKVCQLNPNGAAERARVRRNAEAFSERRRLLHLNEIPATRYTEAEARTFMTVDGKGEKEYPIQAAVGHRHHRVHGKQMLCLYQPLWQPEDSVPEGIKGQYYGDLHVAGDQQSLIRTDDILDEDRLLRMKEHACTLESDSEENETIFSEVDEFDSEDDEYNDAE